MNAPKTAISLTAALLLGTPLSGCSSLTPSFETQEAYVVIDGAGPTNPAAMEKVLAEVTKAVKTQVSSVRASRVAPPTPLPKEPGSFSVSDMGGGSGFGAMMQSRGMAIRTPRCENATLNLSSSDTGLAGYGQQTQYFVCVMPYAAGYRTAVYASYSKASGLLSPATLGADLASLLVGEGSQFIPRLMAGVKTAMEANLHNVKVVQSYIPDSMDGPMIKQRDKLTSAQ
ncbi:hypothetical protein [Noviherbaspirillum autotrophicum]|uniref:Lipoprotein n=1 Tax=Noviherbaspirillum autotrophicum TaxID=709839 RepID=A0A0C1YRK0_9BURK|nr:hypothetical protein [Noviherbaspirillum autotrophicum]KIF83302.1 hypothetical protein TSA66_24665 [Noviherbaspirillum autotrophicum]